MKKTHTLQTLSAALLLLPTVSHAHSLLESTTTLNGLLHPLTGLDHLAAIALLAIIFARSTSLVNLGVASCAFALGGILGLVLPTMAIFPVEVLVLLALPVLIGLSFKQPKQAHWILAGCIGAHGLAHGAEAQALPLASSLAFIAFATFSVVMSAYALKCIIKALLARRILQP